MEVCVSLRVDFFAKSGEGGAGSASGGREETSTTPESPVALAFFFAFFAFFAFFLYSCVSGGAKSHSSDPAAIIQGDLVPEISLGRIVFSYKPVSNLL